MSNFIKSKYYDRCTSNEISASNVCSSVEYKCASSDDDCNTCSLQVDETSTLTLNNPFSDSACCCSSSCDCKYGEDEDTSKNEYIKHLEQTNKENANRIWNLNAQLDDVEKSADVKVLPFIKSFIDIFNSVSPNRKNISRSYSIYDELRRYIWNDKEKYKLYTALYNFFEYLQLSNKNIDILQILNDFSVLFKHDELLTPLTFDKAEWDNNYTLHPKEYDQNRRLSNVFKEEDGSITSIYALNCKTIKTGDISQILNSYKDFMHIQLKEVDDKFTHHTVMYCYDYNDNQWKLLPCSQALKLNKPIYKTPAYEIKVIELKDTSNKAEDYYCFITTSEQIPEEFYNDYTLSYIDTNKKKYKSNVEHIEIMKFLKEHQDLLLDGFKEEEKPKEIRPKSEFEEVIQDVIKSEVNNVCITNVISKIFYENYDLCINMSQDEFVDYINCNYSYLNVLKNQRFDSCCIDVYKKYLDVNKKNGEKLNTNIEWSIGPWFY